MKRYDYLGIPTEYRQVSPSNPSKSWFIRLPRYHHSRTIRSIQLDLLVHGLDKLVLVIGAKGKGKSWSCLRIAKSINPYFSVKRDVVFSFEDLMTKLNDPYLPGGICLIWEEVGTGFASREFMKKDNIDTGKVLQTCRDKHCCILMNVPSQLFVDRQGRLLVHAVMEAKGITQNSENRIAFKTCDTNPMTGKTYNKYNRMRDPGLGYAVSKITELCLPKVEDDIIIEYEAARSAFTKKLNDRVVTVNEKPEKAWRPPTIASYMTSGLSYWDACKARSREKSKHLESVSEDPITK